MQQDLINNIVKKFFSNKDSSYQEFVAETLVGTVSYLQKAFEDEDDIPKFTKALSSLFATDEETVNTVISLPKKARAPNAFNAFNNEIKLSKY